MKPQESERARARVIIFSRPDCHLCEEAKQIIKGSGVEGEYTLEEINIESDEELLRRYRYDIPVVTIDGVEAFRHRVSAEEFRAAVRKRVYNDWAALPHPLR